jgi:diguanylate cyclase
MADDWRNRYLKLAEEAERAEREQQEAERAFTRLVTRLCVAFGGLDPTLDPHIDQLRDAARGGKSGRLLQRAERISGKLVQAADERSRPAVLARLLERGDLGRRQIQEAARLWAEVAAAPGEAGDEQLDRLSQLLQAGLPAPADDERPGLLTRLLGRAQDSDSQPNRRLLEVLRAVQWPGSMAAEVAGFETALEGEQPGDAWVDIVRELSQLTIRTLDQAQNDARAAESFLTELNRHLEELDQHMLGEGERREAARASAERLGREMSQEVDSLSASVRDSADLAELQASVLQSLDRMHRHVRSHLDDESQRRSQAEAEADRLRDELRQLEADTFDLRRQVAKTHQQALSDALTGLPNRRAYDERVAQEWARWKRFSEPLALLVWDVDDFKKINDTFGHKAGDNALVVISKLLRERLRETDFIARYGGEELVVLLTGARQADAERIAEAMRVAVENSGLHARQEPVRVTVSGGLAMFREGDTPEAVFERADKAMYQAKQQGKNRVIVAG